MFILYIVTNHAHCRIFFLFSLCNPQFFWRWSSKAFHKSYCSHYCSFSYLHFHARLLKKSYYALYYVEDFVYLRALFISSRLFLLFFNHYFAHILFHSFAKVTFFFRYFRSNRQIWKTRCYINNKWRIERTLKLWKLSRSYCRLFYNFYISVKDEIAMYEKSFGFWIITVRLLVES